jgi:hypothetical protein
MFRRRLLQLVVIMLICILATGLERPPAARGAINIFASPIQAGCYLARHDTCRIHVDPFSIDIASGKQLVFFQLVAIRSSSGAQTMIWDFRPDVSNPVPFSGSLVTPSLPTRDFAAACGQTYTISLQGQDSGDSGAFNLGLTQPIHCPVATYYNYQPGIRK